MKQTIRLGLTGGIGSGKSTVASIFATLGAIVIDADAISHNLTQANGAAIEAIKQQFGEALIAVDGSLNRQKMRELVFKDLKNKQRLEKFIHPRVKLAMQEQDRNAVKNDAKLIVYDIPLLTESSAWRSILHKILVVDCLEETQVQRVAARNRLQRIEIQRIMGHQANRKMRNSIADLLIFNDSITIEQLREHVSTAAKILLHPFDERNKL